jgi:hypothetical protein
MIENHPLGATVAGHLMVEQAERAIRAPHPSTQLGIAIQFWSGDQAEALQLARFLADLEPIRRDDVVLIFARRFDVEMTDDLYAAELACGLKFPVTHVQSRRRLTGHPDGCYGLWSGTAQACYDAYTAGFPIENVFFAEAEGVPMRWDWIDYLKRAHQKNLEQGKRVTGAWEGTGRYHEEHVNGSFCMHMSCWADHASLHRCAPGKAWDCFHGRVLLSELGPWQAIENLYGAHDVVSLSVFKTMARNRAWLSSVKDGSAWKCAQTLLDDLGNLEGGGI